MSQQQSPIERAVDLLVFAPIGVAMFAKDTVPTFMKMFVSRGQTELQRQGKSLRDHANQYRAVGKFAVKYGGPEVKRQAEGKLDGARRLCEETFTGLIVGRTGGGGEEPAEAPAPKAAPAAAKAEPKPAKPAKPKAPAKAAAKADARRGSIGNGSAAGNGAAASSPAPAAPTLAIPEYDQLSASQVVERLEGLTSGELDAVREYELAHRGRNTILGKITQLTS